MSIRNLLSPVLLLVAGVGPAWGRRQTLPGNVRIYSARLLAREGGGLVGLWPVNRTTAVVQEKRSVTACGSGPEWTGGGRGAGMPVRGPVPGWIHSIYVGYAPTIMTNHEENSDVSPVKPVDLANVDPDCVERNRDDS